MSVLVGAANSTYLRDGDGGNVAVGLGTTSAAGRVAGVGTPVGTLSFNADDGKVMVFIGNNYSGRDAWEVVGGQSSS
jgi:hypothetical protein